MAAAIRQAPIVPSNARDSLWSEVEETKPCPPVLTARSANEQYPYASITAHQKPHFLPSSENSNLVTGGRNRRGHFALDYAGWRYQKKPRTAAEVDAKARELQRDFLTKPGYYNYRSKQSKKPPTKDDVWPDDAEWAFFQALALYPPCGRHQERLVAGGKRMGRNEIIADYIGRAIGEKRERKQVSSHLQVHKNYLCGDLRLMSYLLTPKDMTKINGKEQAALAKQRSVHPGPLPSHHYSADLLPQLTKSDIKGTKNKKRPIGTLEMRNFEMSVVPETVPGSSSNPLHIYTQSSADSRQPDVKFRSFHQCVEVFPQFGMQQINLFGVEGLLAANVSFAFPGTGRLYGQYQLEILMMLQGAYAPGLPFVQSKTTFFDDMRPEEAIFQPGEVMVPEGATEGAPCLYQVPFCSGSWVQTLHRLGSALSKSKEDRPKENRFDGHGGRNKAPGGVEQDVADTLRRLTAVQEIFVCDKKYKKSVTMLVIHWSFEKAAEGDAGRTTWSRIVAPKLEDEWARGGFEKQFEAAMNINDYDFAPLANEGAAQVQPMSQHQTQPQLQSPIEFTPDPNSNWNITVTGDFSAAERESPLPTNNELYGHYDVNTYHPTVDELQLSYELPASIGDFDFGAVDVLAPSGSADQGMLHYDPQWAEYGQMLDPSLALQVSDAHSVYPTPPTIADYNKFADFGLHQHPHQAQVQADGGAQYEVKVEEMSQGRLGHNCAHCMLMPYCTCGGQEIKMSESQ